MLDRVKAAAACAWACASTGEHRWCFRGAVALGVALGWVVGACIC